MSEKTLKYVCLVYGIIESILLVTVGILLINACISIYQIGERPFTPENISAAFNAVAVPVFVLIACTVVGILFFLFFPMNKSAIKPIIDKKITADKLMWRVDPQNCALEYKKIKNQCTLRFVLKAVFLVLSAISAIPAIVHVFNRENFSIIDLEGSVISLLVSSIPFICVATASIVSMLFIESASLDKQIKISKSAIASFPKYRSEAKVSSKQRKATKKKVIVTILRIFVLLTAIIFILLGILNSGMADVLEKAINICTECIGLA